MQRRFIKTGVPELDGPLEGGLPFGKVIEVVGAPCSGKTAFLCQLSQLAAQQGVPEDGIYAVGFPCNWLGEQVMPSGIVDGEYYLPEMLVLKRKLLGVVDTYPVVLLEDPVFHLGRRFRVQSKNAAEGRQQLHGFFGELEQAAQKSGHFVAYSFQQEKDRLPEARRYGTMEVLGRKSDHEGLVIGAGVTKVKPTSVQLRVLSPLQLRRRQQEAKDGREGR